jgi:DNA-directed RNA polymerase specialized sigma subunit
MFNGSSILAHRISAQIAGYDIDCLQVLHSCDNPGCCNPTHLRTGTHTDNMRDKVERKRYAKEIKRNRGNLNKMSKITQAIRDAIIDDPRVYREIADDYGISAAQVCRIKKRLQWFYV